MNDGTERLLQWTPMPWPLSVHALLSSRSLMGSCTGSSVPATGSVPQSLLICTFSQEMLQIPAGLAQK